MIFNSIRKAALLSVLFFPAFLIQSCEKYEEQTIGQDIQPEGDAFGLFRTDTFSIITKTVDADSVVTTNLSATLAGSYYDQKFGRIDCGTYTQFRLASENIKFENDNNVNNLAIDSIVLSLAYSGDYYGDTTTNMVFNVQRIDEDIQADSLYHSTHRFAVQSSLLNFEEGKAYQVRPKNSVVVGDDTLAAQLRIRLKDSFAMEFLNRGGSADLQNNPNFLAWFKGLYLTTDKVNTPGNGAIAYFNPLSLLSRLTIYYRNTVLSDTLSFSMPINTSAMRVTSFSQDYTGTDVAQQLQGAVSGEQEVYVQSGGGVKAQLNFPWLNSIKDSLHVVINKAELILPIQPGTDGSTHVPHERLLVQALKADGTAEILTDQLRETDAYFGGYYNSTTKSYQLTITRYIQEVMSGKREHYGLQVIAAGSGVTANRTILAGSGNAQAKPMLRITYTKP